MRVLLPRPAGDDCHAMELPASCIIGRGGGYGGLKRVWIRRYFKLETLSIPSPIRVQTSSPSARIAIPMFRSSYYRFYIYIENEAYNYDDPMSIVTGIA